MIASVSLKSKPDDRHAALLLRYIIASGTSHLVCWNFNGAFGLLSKTVTDNLTAGPSS